MVAQELHLIEAKNDQNRYCQPRINKPKTAVYFGVYYFSSRVLLFGGTTTIYQPLIPDNKTEIWDKFTCASEIDMDMSQEPLCARILNKDTTRKVDPYRSRDHKQLFVRACAVEIWI